MGKFVQYILPKQGKINVFLTSAFLWLLDTDKSKREVTGQMSYLWDYFENAKESASGNLWKLVQLFCSNKNILFDDLEKMREDDPLQYENLKRQNIHSIVVVPLYDNDAVMGFYGIGNLSKQV